MKKKGVIVVVVIVLAAAGAIVLKNNSNKSSDSATDSTATTQIASNTNQTQNTEQQAPDAENAAETTITYTNDGFSPSELTVNSGTTVTIKNESDKVLQLNSDPHPQHIGNPELNVGTISPGKTTTFTVTTTGSHGYHNHLNDSDTGTLIVR